MQAKAERNLHTKIKREKKRDQYRESRRNLHTQVIFSVHFFTTNKSWGAGFLDLNTALQNTYHACVDIDNNLSDLKKLAGINTAVTAVGTGLGVGATVVGFVKSSKDKEIERLEKILEKLKNIESNMPSKPTNDVAALQSGMDKYYNEHKNDTENDSEEESYISVEDEEVLNKVFEIFKNKFKDEFDFVD